MKPGIHVSVLYFVFLFFKWRLGVGVCELNIWELQCFSVVYIQLTVLPEPKNDSSSGFPSRSSRSFEDSSTFCVETDGSISKFKKKHQDNKKTWLPLQHLGDMSESFWLHRSKEQ